MIPYDPSPLSSVPGSTPRTSASFFGFQGSYADSSGLDYMINRYYTPTTDQFLSVDPDLQQTGQPYAFTGDDPLNMTDPLGLVPGKYYWVNTKWNTFQKTKYTYLCVGNQIHCGGPSCRGGPCVPSLPTKPKPSVTVLALSNYFNELTNWINEVNAAGAAFYAAEHPSPSPASVVTHAVSTAVNGVTSASTAATAIKNWYGAGSQSPPIQWLSGDSPAACLIQGTEVAGATLATGGGDAVFMGAGGVFSRGAADTIAGNIGLAPDVGRHPLRKSGDGCK